jgi:hypothetical protein
MNVKQRNVKVGGRKECKTDECKSGGTVSQLTYFV